MSTQCFAWPGPPSAPDGPARRRWTPVCQPTAAPNPAHQAVQFFMPGFAFHHVTHDQWDKLLNGRTADLITPMDTPPLINRSIYRAPGRQALARATLAYCGIRSARVEAFGPVFAAAASTATIVTIYTLFAMLALAYTAPPLKLPHLGFCEVDVAITHSAGAIVAGYVAQCSPWSDNVPWLLAPPLGLAVLSSILLASCPDRVADQAAGKRTRVLMLGPRRAIRLARCSMNVRRMF